VSFCREKAGAAKLIANPTRAIIKRIFIVSSGGCRTIFHPTTCGGICLVVIGASLLCTVYHDRSLISSATLRLFGEAISIDERRAFFRQNLFNKAPWQEKIHNSLVFPWTLGEAMPKWVWNSTEKRSQLRCGLGQRRHLSDGAFIHQTTLLRIREIDYQSANLSPGFLAEMKDLTDLPKEIPYRSSG
jgi:hypothetical protein